jgi:predicted nucleic acid-binding protein
MRRPPSQCLVVDANIILGVAFGLRVRPAFERVALHRVLVTSQRAQAEILGRANDLRDGSPEALGLARAVLGLLTVFDATTTEPLLEEAGRCLQHATPTRNGSTRDAHLLALAWITDSDICAHDRDFAGTGWPSWSSGNLLAALGG